MVLKNLCCTHLTSYAHAAALPKSSSTDKLVKNRNMLKNGQVKTQIYK